MFERCPKAMLRVELYDAARLIDDVMVFRDGGALPLSGGWHDQPSRWVDAYQVVTSELSALGVPSGR